MQGFTISMRCSFAVPGSSRRPPHKIVVKTEASAVVAKPLQQRPPSQMKPGTNRRLLKPIDMRDFDERKNEIAQELIEAASVGFFYLKNHGIPQEDIDASFEAHRRFCELPHEVKQKTQESGQDQLKESQAYVLGWSETRNAAARLRQSFLCGYDSIMQGHWPDEDVAPGYRQRLTKFMRQNHQVALRVLQAFAIGLGYPEDYFFHEMNPDDPSNLSTMNNNYYDEITTELPPDTLRIFAHVDYECLSMLHIRPGEKGLEVCPGREATSETALQTEWTDMDPIPGTIVVNMGESLEYWSDGKLRANFHRVRYPRPNESKAARQSIAYFTQARASTIFQGPEKKFPPVRFQDILDRKAMKDIPGHDEMGPEEYADAQKRYVLGPDLILRSEP